MSKTQRRAISYTPHESAKPFHASAAQVKALMGPVGSGKSSAWIFEFFVLCYEAEVSVRGLVIRQSWPELRDSTKRTWEEWLPEPVSHWRQVDHQMRVTIRGRDGVQRTHTMDFRHARTAQEATRFLSTEYGFIVLEECAPAFDIGRGVLGAGIPREIFDVCLLRQRQKGIHRIHLLCVFNPPSKRHWTYELFVGPSQTDTGRADLERKSYAFFEMPPFENRANLPPRYYEKLIEQLSPELADRFVYGKPVTVYPGMPVYPQIIEDLHVVDHVPLLGAIGLVTGHDFGRTPAALVAQITTEGQVRCVRELQLWGASSETMAETLERVLRNDYPEHVWLRGWGDPAGQNPTETNDKTSFGILAARGFPLACGAETLAARTEAVKQRASRSVGREPALLVSASGCPLLAEALLGGYRYPKSGDGQIGFAPLKNDYSHIANAFEYLVSGEFSTLTGQRSMELDDPRLRSRRLIPRYTPLDTPRTGGGGGWMSG